MNNNLKCRDQSEEVKFVEFKGRKTLNKRIIKGSNLKNS